MTRIAIIGAGMAGLACAQGLTQAGLRPVLFDKGRGIGGRLATRRAPGLQFDHGAQYVTARDPRFIASLAGLEAAGHVARWDDGQSTGRNTGSARWVGTPGMSSLAKGLAKDLAGDLDLHQGARITAIRPAGAGWLVSDGQTDHPFDRVVVTVPAPQVADLLGQDHPLVSALAPVRMDPCLTLMAGINAPAAFVTCEDADHPLTWIAQDSSKPGRPQGQGVAWVAQASVGFSEQFLEDSAEAQLARMLPLLCDRLAVSADRVSHAAVHRWRYARVATPLGQPFLRDGAATLYLGGDWCLGARVEAAWISGASIAADLLTQKA